MSEGVQFIPLARLALAFLPVLVLLAIVDLCKRSLVTTYAGFMTREKMHSWIEGTEVAEYVARMWPHMTVAIDRDRTTSSGSSR